MGSRSNCAKKITLLATVLEKLGLRVSEDDLRSKISEKVRFLPLPKLRKLDAKITRF